MSSTNTTWTADTNTKSGTVTVYDRSVSTLRITAAESSDAILELFADEGSGNADKWRLWIEDSDYDLHFANYTSGSWANLLTIQDGGNVGIGTVEPNAKLTVEGTISMKEQSDDVAHVAGYSQIWVDDAGAGILMFTNDAGTKYTVDVTAV